MVQRVSARSSATYRPNPSVVAARPQCLPSQEPAHNASWPTNHRIDWRFSVVLSKWLASSSLTHLCRACNPAASAPNLNSTPEGTLTSDDQPPTRPLLRPANRTQKIIAESLRHPISFSLIPPFDIDRLPPNGGTSPRGDRTAKDNNGDQPPSGRLFHDLTTLHDFERILF
jgi:hypothetical protein